MARVLVTGMSATGKSTVTRELARRRHPAVDLDAPPWSAWVEADLADQLTPQPGRDWAWNEGLIRDLLFAHEGRALFVSGCAENMVRLYPLLEKVVLLTAPLATLLERLAARPPGAYGHAAADRRKVAALVATVEPQLRRRADEVIDATLPLEEVVRRVLRLA